MVFVESFDILNVGLLFFSWKEIEFVWFTCAILNCVSINFEFLKIAFSWERKNFIFLRDVSDRFLKQCIQIRKNLCKLLHILHTVPVNLISIFGLHLIFVISIWKTVL